jgi:hypothetical protein
VTVILPPTAIPPVCFPRTDWVYTYVVQAGDTLFSIAQRLGLTLAQLQTGNCITNANQIFVGQILRVPYPPPPPPPTPLRPTFTPTKGGIGPTLQPTSTTIPIPTDTPVTQEPNPDGPVLSALSLASSDPNFRADSTTLSSGQCTTLRWDVSGADSVFLDGQATVFNGAEQICPPATTRYTLLVVYPDGSQSPYFLTVSVQ